MRHLLRSIAFILVVLLAASVAAEDVPYYGLGSSFQGPPLPFRLCGVAPDGPAARAGLRAGDAIGKIGHGGDHRRPGLSRRAVARAIIAARMKPQRVRMVESLDAAIEQIGLHERPADRLRHGEEPTRCFGRTNGITRHRHPASRFPCLLRFGTRQRQESTCFLGNIAEGGKAAALADDVEEIAMFGRGGVGPMPGSAGTGVRSAEPDEHRPPGRVAHIAHRPIASLAPAIGEIVTAYRLGITGEEVIDILGLEELRARMTVEMVIQRPDGREDRAELLCRVDTADEVEYYKNGGILHYVLRGMAKAA